MIRDITPGRGIPAGGVPFGPAQLETLARLCETFLPDDEPGWRAEVPERVAAMVAGVASADTLARLRGLLSVIELAPAVFLLTGRWRRFSTMTGEERERFLRALAGHRLGALRGAFQALKRLAAVNYYAAAGGPAGSPIWRAMGYPGPIARSDARDRPIHPLTIAGDTELVCDVVIAGSGAGGGIAGGELAAAGLDVVVLEKGDYVAEPDFSQRELDMLRRMYDGGGRATTDQGMVVLAGSCLGGGTVVNYTTSLRLPADVRATWARESGLELFESDELSRAFDAVEEGLGVNTEHGSPSTRDAVVAEGLRALGWHVEAMPRNVQGCTQDDACGYCGMGCVRGAKQSTLKTYLAAAHARGARVVVNCEARRVLIDRGRAAGIEARTRDGHRLVVRARATVAAGGAIHTPALLLRSGLGGAVGRHLHLHPVASVWGFFDREIRPWAGTIQARYSEQLADLDGGYGVRFETAGTHPSFAALALPWRGATGFDALMKRLPFVLAIGVLTRDRGAGRITIDRAGAPEIHYQVSPYDQRHARAGVEGAARVLLAAGAREVLASQIAEQRLRAAAGDGVEAWMTRLDRVGWGANRTFYGSFHQMGTCRMGRDPASSVVDANGETHRVKRLFVADASLFPSASGVNPMLTIAALARVVADRIAGALRR